MASIKGITIQIAGNTSPLVSSLKEADKAINNTKSALKAVNKALELDPTNVELLAQKEALLTNEINATKEKLEAMKAAAELAKKGLEDGTTTREQYAQLTAEIALTEAELQKLEQGGEEAGAAAEEAGNKWEGFGDVLAKAAQAAAVAITAVTAAATAAAKALVDCAVGGAEFADEILTLSTQTGVSTQTLQEWGYAAELIDVSLDTMTSALTKTTRLLGSYAEGNASAVENLDRLGVAATNADGSLRDSEDVFFDIVDALGEIDNETERDALAMELLGKSAQDLNPLIEAGADQLRAYGEEAHDAGYVLDDETLEAFGDFDNQLRRLNAGTTAAKNALGTVLLPILDQLAGEGVELLGEFSNAVLDADGDVEQIGAIVGEMIPQIIDTIMQYLPLLLDLAGSLIESVAQGLIDNLDRILTAAVQILLTIVDGIIQSLPKLIPVVVDLVMQIATALINNLPLIIDAAIQIVLAIVDGLAEAMPELIPATIDAIITITEALIENLPTVIETSMELIGAIVEGMTNALPDLITGAMSVVTTIVDTVATAGPDLVSEALSWGADLISSFISGITNAIPSLIASLEGVAGTIASYLHFTSPDVGPLAHDLIGKSGKDMIVTFADGMDSELSTLENSLEDTGNIIADGMTKQADYSGVLNGINNNISNMGGQTVIPVYIGDDLLDTIIVNAFNRQNYRTGAV